MAAIMTQALALLSLGALVRGEAQSFRGSEAAQSLEARFMDTVNPGESPVVQARVNEFKEALLTPFAALPKDEAGKLELQSARYILHRLFVQRSGWYIRGLEPGGNLFGAGESGLDLGWVPDSLQSALTMQQSSGSVGVSLRDLAVLGVAIERLADDEVMETMRQIRQLMQIPETEYLLDRRAAQRAVHTYMQYFLGNRVYTLERAYSGEFARTFQFWNTTIDWFQPIQEEVLRRGGLGDADALPFLALVGVAKEFSRRYVAYNELECRRLKQGLTGAWSLGASTGRLRLADFHQKGLSDDQFSLQESNAFLRTLGALDESNSSMPMVVIANYLGSSPNCLEATNKYSVCCRNECEDLLGHLELKIGAPAAEASRVLELVRELSSDTVAVPREVPAHLEQRLGTIAARHAGLIPLHGRLFAQWMHHVYPSECPYPHVAGSTNALSAAGEDSDASREELQQSAAQADTCGPEQAASEWQSELPWSEHEELLSANALLRRRGAGKVGRYAGMLLMALSVAALLHSRRGRALSERHRVAAFSLIFLAAFALNAVNRALTLLMFACVLLSRRARLMEGELPKYSAKCAV